MSAHAELRAATRDAHDRVDAIFSRLDLSDQRDYARFLTAQAGAFLPAEEALTRAGAAKVIADWDAMRRSPALLADLRSLGIDRPTMVDAPIYRDAPAVLGGAYVLEGSRLGGALLRRTVAPGLPRRFLDSVQPPGRWRAFIAELDRRLYESEALGAAIRSAKETFALFERVNWDA